MPNRLQQTLAAPADAPPPSPRARAAWLAACSPWLLREHDRRFVADLARLEDSPPAATARRLAALAAWIERRATEGAQ